jgi:hypothetical protein
MARCIFLSRCKMKTLVLVCFLAVVFCAAGYHEPIDAAEDPASVADVPSSVDSPGHDAASLLETHAATTTPTAHPECEAGAIPKCFKSQYHTPDQWKTVAECVSESTPAGRLACLPVPQSIYKDLFSTHCGGYCKQSAYRTDMCQATNPSLGYAFVTACCPNGVRPVSKKCITKRAADLASEATSVGCASMYGPDWTGGKCKDAGDVEQPFYHQNQNGVPKTMHAGNLNPKLQLPNSNLKRNSKPPKTVKPQTYNRHEYCRQLPYPRLEACLKFFQGLVNPMQSKSSFSLTPCKSNI